MSRTEIIITLVNGDEHYFYTHNESNFFNLLYRAKAADNWFTLPTAEIHSSLEHRDITFNPNHVVSVRTRLREEQ